MTWLWAVFSAALSAAAVLTICFIGRCIRLVPSTPVGGGRHLLAKAVPGAYRPWTPNPRPHAPTRRCGPYHCWRHDCDELADSFYLVCMECRHLYRTRLHLVWQWGAMLVRTRPAWGTHENALFDTSWWGHWRLRRPKNIHFCPVCSHDF